MTADRIVREPERRSITGVSSTTAWRMERKGQFPRRVKVTDRRVGWHLSELLAWVASRQTVTLKPLPTPEDRAALATH